MKGSHLDHACAVCGGEFETPRSDYERTDGAHEDLGVCEKNLNGRADWEYDLDQHAAE